MNRHVQESAVLLDVRLRRAVTGSEVCACRACEACRSRSVISKPPVGKERQPEWRVHVTREHFHLERLLLGGDDLPVRVRHIRWLRLEIRGRGSDVRDQLEDLLSRRAARA